MCFDILVIIHHKKKIINMIQITTKSLKITTKVFYVEVINEKMSG